jgi:hypothetical protein
MPGLPGGMHMRLMVWSPDVLLTTVMFACDPRNDSLVLSAHIVASLERSTNYLDDMGEGTLNQMLRHAERVSSHIAEASVTASVRQSDAIAPAKL